MGDLPWADFVHEGDSDCPAELWLDDLGTTGELTELRVRCGSCKMTRLLSQAVGTDNPALGRCDGSQSWLGPAAGRAACDATNRLLIRTASNAYFPQKLSVFSLPDRGQDLHAAVARV